MKHVKKSVLLWYSPQEMYELVSKVEDYPKFLPWCEQAEILSRDDTGMTARLHLKYLGVRQAFTTRNVNTPGESMRMHLVDGPFSTLEGTWLFKPVGQAEQPACKIEFDLEYAFSSRTLSAAVSPVFDRIANTFVDSFVKRAEAVYGNR